MPCSSVTAPAAAARSSSARNSPASCSAPGQLLDATKYFIVLPDGIGHGKSSKPSDGLHAKFPHYGYTDMVDAQYRLLTEGLKVNHLRLVMGTSMGGMQTWVWGERHPDFMDALMPLASLPTQISGRNRVWRKTLIDAIRNDPAWNGGNYTAQPPSLRTAAALIFFMGSNPILRQAQMPTLAKADEVLDAVRRHGDARAGRQRRAVPGGRVVGLRPGPGPREDPRAACWPSIPRTISSTRPSSASSSARSSACRRVRWS